MAIQLFEAVMGFFLFVIATFFILQHAPITQKDDLSKYRMEMAVSSWNTLYSSSVLKDLTLNSDGEIDDPDSKIHNRLCELGKESGMCYFIGGGRISNCPFGGTSGSLIINEERVSLEKILVVKDSLGNVGFRKIIFTVAPPTGNAKLC